MNVPVGLLEDPMQQAATVKLYAYWNAIRNGRIAPRRFEINPARIAGVLRETFIAECNHAPAYPLRLAGTELCQQFGQELRGIDFLQLWTLADRRTISATLEQTVNNGAVAHGTFYGVTENQREALFEFALLPVIHTGPSVDRLLGIMTAIDRPFWLGAAPLVAIELRDVGLHWPDGLPPVIAATNADTALDARRRFRVVQGGLSH